MPDSRTLLEARDLSKKLGGRFVVRDVSFEVHPSEVMGFLGPNGAGKTTTIRMLTGLIRPTSGSVIIDGTDLHRHFELAISNLGCIVETPDLYGFMTGRENLRHFARMVRSAGEDEIDRVAAITRIGERLGEKVRTYSLGMRQRLGIAIALLGHPKLLILDEPANGLDPSGIREIRALIRRLAEEEGVSVFISSHLLAEIELMCDRVAIINRGEIVQTGSVEELVTSRTRFVIRTPEVDRAATLLGERHLELTRRGDGVAIESEDLDVPETIRLLTAQGVPILAASPERPTLEEMFLETTGGDTVQ